MLSDELSKMIIIDQSVSYFLKMYSNCVKSHIFSYFQLCMTPQSSHVSLELVNV